MMSLFQRSDQKLQVFLGIPRAGSLKFLLFLGCFCGIQTFDSPQEKYWETRKSLGRKNGNKIHLSCQDKKKKNPGREISRMGMIPKALAAVGKLGKKGQEIGREEREKLGEMGEKLGKKGGGKGEKPPCLNPLGFPAGKGILGSAWKLSHHSQPWLCFHENLGLDFAAFAPKFSDSPEEYPGF